MARTSEDVGRLSDVVHDMAEAARWAPSVHNTQPWRFDAVDDGLAVRVDPARGLPVLDPVGRMRTISCGTAVLNAAVALAARDLEPQVLLLPDLHDPTLMAVVRAGGPRPAGPDDTADASALTVRRAHRRMHRRERLPEAVLTDLRQAVVGEGAELSVPDAAGRRRLAGLLTRAVGEQARNPAFVAEIEEWIRHWGPAAPPVDGVPVQSLGTAPYPVDSLVQEHTTVPAGRDTELEEALADATVVGISTPGDTERDWLVAGMALERLWLRVTTLGYAVTFADQATQQAATRRELPDVLGASGTPQLVLRLGMPLVDVPPTPRRPLEDVLGGESAGSV